MSETVMLLIDADNVSVDVMEQAVAHLLGAHGSLHVRRAYCTAESALKHQAAFKRLGIKPMVNLAAGKNSTDIALAVDAIDLVLAERPEVVAIASSDSDFAPLVQRLREKGCRVLGLGQGGKTGDETQRVYDAFTVFEHRKAAAAPRAARKSAAPPPSAAVARVPAPVPPPVKAPPAAARKAATPPMPEKVAAVLAAVPDLAGGEWVRLNVAAERLRAAQRLSKSGTAVKLFRQHPGHFELLPEKRPDRVRYMR